MSGLPDSPSPQETPKPSVAEMQRQIAATLVRPSAPRHAGLFVTSIASAALAGALLATEPALPTRTRIALASIVAIGLSWAGFSTWVLSRRRVLLGLQRVVAAWMAVAFTALFTLEAWIVGQSGMRGRWAYGAVATGMAMLSVAVVLVIRARRRFDALTRRRAELERQIGRGGSVLAAVILFLGMGADRGDAQDVRRPIEVTTKPGRFAISGQAIAVTEGRMKVPANRSSGSRAWLTLAFVQFKSTASAPGSPIVFLAGGPGDAGTRAVGGMPIDLLDTLRSIADVIAFDQRGTGLSEPINPACPPGGMLPTDRAGDPSAFLSFLRARVTTCIDSASRAGVDVMGLTTVESADDLDDLRRAIGATKLMLLAGSYGTHLALATARRHPQAVDRMVLAGVEGFDDTFKLPSRVEDVLAVIAAAKRPTLIADLRMLRARLAAEPARFAFPTGQAIVLGEWDLRRWVSESMDAVPKIDALVTAIPAMIGNDFSALGRWALGYRVPRPLNLMNLAMDCASYASADRLAQIRRTALSTVLGDAINFPLPDICDIPGLPRLAEAYRGDWTSDVPTLLVSGGLDGRTPVQNAVGVATHLPQARLLVIDHASHGLFREPVVNSALIAFLANSRPASR